MNASRSDYTSRGIPLFNAETWEPYPVGEVPQSGWYLIEPAGVYSIPEPVSQKAPDERKEAEEVIDEEALRAMCESFDSAVNGGNGLQVNNDHLYLRCVGENPALGWCKALDYGECHGRLYLAAWIEWVADAHRDLNQGKYWAFSTEYRLDDYQQRTETGYSPMKLAGLAVTNNPDHESQPGIINSRGGGSVITHSRSVSIFFTTMIKKPKQQRVLHSDTELTEDENRNNEGLDVTESSAGVEAEQSESAEVQTANEQSEEELETHSGDEGWLGICNEIAQALNLPDTATGDDILKAVIELKSDFELLKQASEETSEAITHSKAPLPRRLLRSGQRMDRKVVPSRVSTHRTPEGRTVEVPQRDVDLVSHCRAAVEAERRQLGRQLTPGEYNRAWGQAAAAFASRRK